MSSDFDDKLRTALRPEDPGEEFTRGVLARIARERDALLPQSRWPYVRRKLQWVSAALAASLVLVVIVAHEAQQRRDRADGLAAREQLLEALRVTSDKLDLAYQVVKTPPREEEDTAHDS